MYHLHISFNNSSTYTRGVLFQGSPTKDAPSPTKDKKKKKNKFRMPSFSKSKKKESKESTI